MGWGEFGTAKDSDRLSLPMESTIEDSHVQEGIEASGNVNYGTHYKQGNTTNHFQRERLRFH